MANKNKGSTKFLLSGIWRHLAARRRAQLVVLMFIMLASGLSEILTMGAIIPFLSVLTSPNILWQNNYINPILKFLNISSDFQLICLCSLLFALAAILSASIRLINLWFNEKLSAVIGSDLSTESFARTLYQPYLNHLQKNTSEVMSTSTTQISHTITVVSSTLGLCTGFIISISILIALILIDWYAALIACIVFISAYGLIILLTKARLYSNSLITAYSSKQQIKALQEGLGAIREILLDGSQRIYIEEFRKADYSFRSTQANSSFLSTFPRYGLEALGLVFITLLAILLLSQRGDSSSLLPTLGAIALGAQRLLPSLQQLYAGISSVRSYSKSVSNVITSLDQPIDFSANKKNLKPLIMQECIELKNVSFRYASDLPFVLENVNIRINKGECVGVVGKTGSGKSTFQDILMGLLEPTSGQILIDGHDLYDKNYPCRLLEWRLSLSHVPQDIFLTDNSIASNIAFGVPNSHINNSKLIECSDSAQLSSFIYSTTADFQTVVGERGVRLSGGQRQRIGIARALYKGSEILVLDEATSALDTRTESAVMKSINDLSSNLTMIIVAHRHSTLSNCDSIYQIQDGCVIPRDLNSLF